MTHRRETAPARCLQARTVCVFAAIWLLSACGGSDTGTPVQPPVIPQPAQNVIATGSIATSGGAVTVAKPGDALNGLSLTIDAGTFATSTSVTIASNPNTNVPRTASIVPISPKITITTNQPGFAGKPVVLRVPATVPAGSFPVLVAYDSATGRIEPLTTIAYDATSVTALARNLNAGNIAPKVTANVGAHAGGVSLSVAADSGVQFNIAAYAIPAEVIMQDYDTGFRPGQHDWEFAPVQTEPLADLSGFGALVSEIWYYNTRASFAPLRNRFAVLKNASFSDRLGLRWVTVTDAAVNTDLTTYLSSAYNRLAGQKPNEQTSAVRDQMQFFQIRAGFALAAMNGSRPVPVLVDLRTTVLPGEAFFHLVAAYRAVGRQIYVADVAASGDSTRVLEFPADAEMTPYVVGSGMLKGPIAIALGQAVQLSSVAAGYQQVLDGTIGASIFPASRLASHFGQVYDTAYVVDTLRIWTECPTCRNSFATTITPRPAANVGNAWRTYYVRGTAAYDSIGGLSSNGIKIDTTLVASGEERTFGFALGSARASGIVSAGAPFTWLDWRQMLLRRLAVTMAPASLTAPKDSAISFSLGVTAALLPSRVSYRWNFDDGTALVTTTVANTTHAFTGTGSYSVVGEIIDERNSQVIGRARTTVTIGGGIIAWKFNTMNVAFTTAGPNVNSDGKWLLDSARFVRMQNGGSQGGIRLVEQPFAASGLPIRTAAQGLYILDARELTTATVNYPLNNNTFASTQFAGASLTLDASPRVYAWEAVRALQITPEPTCKDPSESFTRIGTPTSGRVAGLTVQYCWDRFAPPQPGFEYLVGPRITIATDVNYSGTTASGTITLTYLFQQPNLSVQKKIATVTFTALRL
jgi:PKD domain